MYTPADVDEPVVVAYLTCSTGPVGSAACATGLAAAGELVLGAGEHATTNRSAAHAAHAHEFLAADERIFTTRGVNGSTQLAALPLRTNTWVLLPNRSERRCASGDVHPLVWQEACSCA